MKQAWGGVIALIFVLLVIAPAWAAARQGDHAVRLAADQVATLCELRFDPPVEGVGMCWQNRCFETDSRGVWKHSITVTAGQWYEFVLTDSNWCIEGVRGPSNAYVMLMSDKRIRFRFNSTPGAHSGPFTISVIAPVATETATATNIPEIPDSSPTPSVTATAGPSATPTIEEPPTPDWPPVPHPPATLDPNGGIPWRARLELEQRSINEEARGNLPDLAVLRMDPLYAAATTHNGIAGLWVMGHEPTGHKNWRVPAGRPETGSFLLEYEGDTLRCIAFSNMLAVEVLSSGRFYVLQYAGYMLAECYPGSSWEVEQ